MRTLLLLFVYTCLLCVLQTQARRRNLTEITYRFTNCDSTNHDGPRVESRCRPLYEAMESPIAETPNTLFQFPDGSYDGAQGFHIPRNDLYNITIAGARGGEGVCNFHYGRGGMISAQIRLTTDYEYLILVGHRGSSVCDLLSNVDHPVCQFERPANLTQVQDCYQFWFDWTQSLEMAPDIQFYSYNFNGGGGGGGASMVWPRRTDNKEFTELPIAIAPGGGGSSAVLDYEGLFASLDTMDFRYPQTDNVGIYQFHLDAHREQYFYGWPEGVRGYFNNRAITTSGAGGGWGPVADAPLLDVDGKLLGDEINFAQGGFDCARVDASWHIFTNVFGGYGGGGGGCGSGGGGGGYTGGHVVQNINNIPGSGGDAGLFNLIEFPIVSETVPFDFNDADGFVEIVASNCGCVGQCMVYTEESEFECICPNDTLLADDGRSCYQEKNVSYSEEEPLTFADSGESFHINGLQFEQSFFTFGLDVLLSVTNQDVACAVVFVGEDFQSVLASNPVRAGTGRAHQVTILGNTTEGIGPSTDYVPFLEYPISVTGALLLTNGQCSLSSPLQVNISSETPFQNFSAFSSLNDSEVATLARLIFAGNDFELPTGTITPASPGNSTAVATIGAALGVIIGSVAIAIVVICILLVLYRRRRTTQKAQNMQRLQSLRQLTNSPLAADGQSNWLLQRPPRLQSPTQYTKMYPATSGLNSLAIDGQPKLLTDSDEQYYKTVFSSILVPYASLTVKEKIGQGAFGVVFRGELKRSNAKNTEDIAIKTIKNLESRTEFQAFFEESLLMKDFEHPNILGLAGVCFDTPDGVPYILLPFMVNGSLKDFLKKKRSHVTNVDTLPKDVYVSNLVCMCMDIASGMEYLARERFVHRDLAARNCMVDASLLIKVGDFGLARDVYSGDYYRASKEAMIPVKWMAPETLLDRICNEKTDVWSFGVTCWEVFSLGRAPYPGISNKDVLKHITAEKERLERPTLCSEQMYTLAMSSCWKLLPEDRPSFSELVFKLQEYWEEHHAYVIEVTDHV